MAIEYKVSFGCGRVVVRADWAWVASVKAVAEKR